MKASAIVAAQLLPLGVRLVATERLAQRLPRLCQVRIERDRGTESPDGRLHRAPSSRTPSAASTRFAYATCCAKLRSHCAFCARYSPSAHPDITSTTSARTRFMTEKRLTATASAQTSISELARRRISGA